MPERSKWSWIPLYPSRHMVKHKLTYEMSLSCILAVLDLSYIDCQSPLILSLQLVMQIDSR